MALPLFFGKYLHISDAYRVAVKRLRKAFIALERQWHGIVVSQAVRVVNVAVVCLPARVLDLYFDAAICRDRLWISCDLRMPSVTEMRHPAQRRRHSASVQLRIPIGARVLTNLEVGIAKCHI